MFWFTNDDSDNVGSDYHGSLKNALKYAEKLAKELKQDIVINKCEDIVDYVFYIE